MQVYLLITNKCNLNCSICIRANNNPEFMEMDYNTYKRVLSGNNLSNTDIIVSGGEPTLHDSFCEIVEYACEVAKNVSVTTNGTMNYYVESLSKKKNLKFQISIDGDEITNDKIRGSGVYSKIVNTLKKFEECRIDYSVASVVSKKNEEAISKLIPFLATLKSMRYWRLSYEMPFGNAGFHDMLTADEWNRFVDDIIEKAKFKLKIQKIFPFELYDQKKFEVNDSSLEIKRYYNCGSGCEKLYVYPDFNVYSCTCLTDFGLGNLKEATFKEIISGEKIKRFSEYQINKDVVCHKCKYYAVCRGGCIGMSYHYFGEIGKGDIRCPILRSYYEEKNILF